MVLKDMGPKWFVVISCCLSTFPCSESFVVQNTSWCDLTHDSRAILNIVAGRLPHEIVKKNMHIISEAYPYCTRPTSSAALAPHPTLGAENGRLYCGALRCVGELKLKT